MNDPKIYSGGLPVVPVCARQGHRHYSEAPALLRKVPKQVQFRALNPSVVPVLALLTTVCSYSATLALRGTNVHTKRTRTGVFTGVDMSRKVRDSRTKPSTVQVVVVHIHLD